MGLSEVYDTCGEIRPVPEVKSNGCQCEGAAVGGMAGNPLAGAAGAAFNQVAGVIGNDVPEFRLSFRLGAFDLARRLNRDLRNIPRMPELLGSILTRAENAALGLA